jgi:hypothetical protein
VELRVWVGSSADLSPGKESHAYWIQCYEGDQTAVINLYLQVQHYQCVLQAAQVRSCAVSEKVPRALGCCRAARAVF